MTVPFFARSALVDTKQKCVFYTLDSVHIS